MVCRSQALLIRFKIPFEDVAQSSSGISSLQYLATHHLLAHHLLAPPNTPPPQLPSLIPVGYPHRGHRQFRVLGEEVEEPREEEELEDEEEPEEEEDHQECSSDTDSVYSVINIIHCRKQSISLILASHVIRIL